MKKKWVIFKSVAELDSAAKIRKGCTIADSIKQELFMFDTKEEMLEILSAYGAVVRTYKYIVPIYHVTEYFGQLWEIDAAGNLDYVVRDDEGGDLCYADLNKEASIEKDGWDY